MNGLGVDNVSFVFFLKIVFQISQKQLTFKFTKAVTFVAT